MLNWSSVKPNGTLNTLPISIQVNSAAVRPDCVKIKQLHVKLTSTAAMEIKPLTVFHLSVKSTITTALASGVRRMIHGKIEFIRSLKFQAADVVEVRGLSRPVERYEDGQAHGNFGRRNCDDEEDKHLGVVIR